MNNKKESVYKTHINDHYYEQGNTDLYWDNYHTLIPWGDIDLGFLTFLNPRLKIIDKPVKVKPTDIFKHSPHVIVLPPEDCQFFIGDYLEYHMGFRDKRNPNLYGDGFDVFLISDDPIHVERWMYIDKSRPLPEGVEPWMVSSQMFGLEFITPEEYLEWLQTHPGNKVVDI